MSQDDGMPGRLQNLLLETGVAQPLGEPLGGPARVTVMLELRADGRNAEKVVQLGPESAEM